MAADIHAYDEHLKTAIKRKFNILKLAPPARNFEEASEYVQMAESEKVKFAVANPGRFNPSYITAHELIPQGHIGQVFLIAAYCSFASGGPALLVHRPAARRRRRAPARRLPAHRPDPLELSRCPQQVYALNTNGAPDKQQRLYLTEDTSVVSLRFTDAFVGSITATRRNEVGPNEL